MVEVDQILTFQARDLIRQGLQKGWHLRPNDAIHLATAIRIGVDEFHTYDGKFDKLESQCGFRVRNPRSSRLPLIGGSNE